MGFQQLAPYEDPRFYDTPISENLPNLVSPITNRFGLQ